MFILLKRVQKAARGGGVAAWAAMGCGDSINCADYGAPSGQPQQVPQPKDLKQLDKKGPSQGDPVRIQPETAPPQKAIAMVWHPHAVWPFLTNLSRRETSPKQVREVQEDEASGGKFAKSC